MRQRRDRLAGTVVQDRQPQPGQHRPGLPADRPIQVRPGHRGPEHRALLLRRRRLRPHVPAHLRQLQRPLQLPHRLRVQRRLRRRPAPGGRQLLRLRQWHRRSHRRVFIVCQLLRRKKYLQLYCNYVCKRV